MRFSAATLSALTTAITLATLIDALPSVMTHRRATHSNPATPEKRSSGDPKYVVAHHMVGNTYPYQQQDWLNDINLASANGLDGFVLNVGSDDWQPDRVSDAYAAAAQANSTFKLMISLDMAVNTCGSAADAAKLRQYVTKYSSHPNQLRIQGRVAISSFSGSDCTFGEASSPLGWKNQFTAHPDLQGNSAVHFVPSFFTDPNQFKSFDGVINGMFNWNGGWPTTVTNQFVNDAAKTVVGGVFGVIGGLAGAVSGVVGALIGANTSDVQFRQGLAQTTTTQTPTFIASVSPWFSTHYPASTFGGKNFIYLADQWLWNTRWENVISARDSVDIVEIVTWNDYGESSYIGPIEGAQPMSQAWVDGMNHTGFLDMVPYYATAFRTGSYPKITEDKIYMWARPHSQSAVATNDPAGKPSNTEACIDAAWVVVFATAPSTVTLSTSNSNSQTTQVQAGVTKLSINLHSGDTMSGTIMRNNKVVKSVNPKDFTFQANPQTYNFNCYMAYA